MSTSKPTKEVQELIVLVEQQSEDLNLWEDPATDRESQLQDALRILHFAIEHAAGLTDALDS